MLHVLEVETNSPAELAGLVPYKDYLLGTAEKVSCSNIILIYRLIQRESIYLCNCIFIVYIVYVAVEVVIEIQNFTYFHFVLLLLYVYIL